MYCKSNKLSTTIQILYVTYSQTFTAVKNTFSALRWSSVLQLFSFNYFLSFASVCIT